MPSCTRIYFTTLLLLSSFKTYASTPNDILRKDFKEWTIHENILNADINRDKKMDFLATLYKPEDKESEVRETQVVIYVGNGKGEFSQAIVSSKVSCIGCGGAKAPWDIPLANFAFTKSGVLEATYTGGSRISWNHVMKWRWNPEKKDLILIGETYESFDSLDEDAIAKVFDVNYLTFKAVRTEGKKKRICKLPRTLKIPAFSQFDFESNEFSTEVDRLCP